MNFTIEYENFGSLSISDITVCRQICKVDTSVYTKPTFIEVSTNRESLISNCQKRGLLQILVYRSFKIYCDLKTFHLEINDLKTIMKKNTYPPNSIDLRIKSFLNKQHKTEVVVNDVRKRVVSIELLFLVRASFQIRKKFQRLFANKLTSINLKTVFTSSVRVKRCYFQDLFINISVVAVI